MFSNFLTVNSDRRPVILPAITAGIYNTLNRNIPFTSKYIETTIICKEIFTIEANIDTDILENPFIKAKKKNITIKEPNEEIAERMNAREPKLPNIRAGINIFNKRTMDKKRNLKKGSITKKTMFARPSLTYKRTGGNNFSISDITTHNKPSTNNLLQFSVRDRIKSTFISCNSNKYLVVIT